MENNTRFDPVSVTEIRIQYKNKLKSTERPRVSSSRDAERIFRPIFEEFLEHRECMYAMYLNRANKALGCLQIGVGGVAGVAADPKIIFQGGLKVHASGIILAHNHPSGNSLASQADIGGWKIPGYAAAGPPHRSPGREVFLFCR